MAGKTLDEACTAQRNARRNGRNGNGNRNSQPNPNATITVATSNGATPVTINGQTFFLTPTPSVPTSVNTAVAISDATFPGNLSDYDALSTFTPSVNIALAPPSALPEGATAVNPNSDVGPMPLCDQIEYEAYVAFNGSSHTSVDWNLNSVMSDTAPAIHPVVYTTSHLPLTCGTTIPFILNSGTNCHILPERSDFKLLHPIPPITVKGFGGSSIQATGIGTIDVCIASGLKLSLMNVLFVPNSTIRLLLVSSLNRSGNYVTHFDSNTCWVTNRSGATIICGMLSPNRQLYTVSLASASVTHVPHSPSALYAAQTPDVEMWHCHLRHCNV